MDIQAYIVLVGDFLNSKIVPLLMSLAFVFFLWNAMRYFIVESDSEEGRTKAKSLAIYGIIAFVLIVVFWGIVNLFLITFGINGGTPAVPDYMGSKTNGITAPVYPPDNDASYELPLNYVTSDGDAPSGTTAPVDSPNTGPDYDGDYAPSVYTLPSTENTWPDASGSGPR